MVIDTYHVASENCANWKYRICHHWEKLTCMRACRGTSRLRMTNVTSIPLTRHALLLLYYSWCSETGVILPSIKNYCCAWIDWMFSFIRLRGMFSHWYIKSQGIQQKYTLCRFKSVDLRWVPWRSSSTIVSSVSSCHGRSRM